MKKFLIILLAIFTFSVTNCFAQVQWYTTTSVAIKYRRYDNYYQKYIWTKWSDWEKCRCDVKFDLDKDLIIIYSSKIQIYKIISLENPPYDPTGTQSKFRVVDNEGDYGTLRLRIENNGNSQIYVDFADVMWVYNVVREQ